jgi:uncharacterized protein
MALVPRAVLDTNVILAAQRSNHPASPNTEILQRWRSGGFIFLYSRDTAIEYADKLIEHGVSEADIALFLKLLRVLGEHVEIEFFHLKHYPVDSDDIAFLLCALNGNASHLVTYDEHLAKLQPFYRVAICEPLAFLRACRLVAPQS